MEDAPPQSSSLAGGKLKLIDKDDISQPSHLEPESKRPKLSENGAKVCIICRCETHNQTTFEVFVLDLNGLSPSQSDDPYVLRFPNLRFDFVSFAHDGFCVVGSILYVFEGYTYIGSDPMKKSVFANDLSSSSSPPSSPPHIIHKADLKPVAKMNLIKKFPIPIPAPDGEKILIVSSMINQPPFQQLRSDYKSTRSDYCCDGVDFELFDIRTKSSINLPRMSPDLAGGVVAYAMDNQRSILHLQTASGSFTLDLQSPTEWGPFYFPHGCLPHDRSLLIGKELCVCAMGAYDISDYPGDGDNAAWDELIMFPLSSSLSRIGDCCVALVGDANDGDDRECSFCVAQPFVTADTRLAHLIVDVCRFDFARYRADKTINPVVRDKTFRFCVGEGEVCCEFVVVNSFSMSS